MRSTPRALAAFLIGSGQAQASPGDIAFLFRATTDPGSPGDIKGLGASAGLGPPGPGEPLLPSGIGTIPGPDHDVGASFQMQGPTVEFGEFLVLPGLQPGDTSDVFFVTFKNPQPGDTFILDVFGRTFGFPANATFVPEPGTLLLVVAGLACLAARLR